MIGFEFMKNNGAQRVRNYDPQPLLLDGGILEGEDGDEQSDLFYECAKDQWHAFDIRDSVPPIDWQWRPLRFIDGKDYGRTVAWLQTQEGYPVPVRLAEVGAASLTDQDSRLRREYETVEKVLSFIVNPFPWDEIESFAIALQEQGVRLLPCLAKPSFSFEEMRRATQNRTKQAMDQLEKQVLAWNNNTPTLVDGRLEPRMGAFNQHADAVVGLIKTHYRTYLHPNGLRMLYELAPGERTPAFCLEKKLSVISWYLRLNGQGEMPDWGLVRLEVPRSFFEGVINREFSYLDYLSNIVYEYRCRSTSYKRAPISIYPVQRAEESLSALFTPLDTLVQRFYCYTNL
ncbi:MAG TPA: hypothetical protein VFV38_43355 [Ktedonobacteraceae bacterium]|nr:hypothetical protein [Ktedonobacteraceae bacterium]